ncbi:TonB-dependent siderophore receptor [Vibrio sp. TRT 21S02]|uniref:TonB-dependent siderophore receptor n=1 Tax=Vibrio sp. TRT 21S02 TaxID=3418507 RepID=UPI003CE86438
MQLPTTFRYSAVALALLTPFSATAAETNSPETSQETITILGKAYRNTATKTALTPEETPQSITVIEGELLEQRGVKSLNQALRYAPGVVTENKGSSVTMYDTFRIRGFEANQSYYDGLLLQGLKGWNLQPQIDPIALQQIEIFKGPTSVLYGSMPPGGMINMIAKSPQQERATKVGVATGSRNLMEASVDTTGQIGTSDFSYRLIALARKQDSESAVVEEERYLIAPSVDWQVNENTLINFNLYYQNDPAMGMNSALPASGMFIANPNGTISRSTYAGDKNWSTFERKFLMAGYKIHHDFSGGWTFLQNARYTDAELLQENTYHTSANYNPASGTLVRNIYSTEESSKGFVIDNQLSGQVNWGRWDHNLLFGADYQKLKGDSVYKEYQTSDLAFYQFNIFTPNNDMLDRSSLSEVYNAKANISVEQLGFYFQDQMRRGGLVLIAGGRFDNYKSTDDMLNATADESAFSYRVGALYEFESGFSPYLSYATSFQPVAGTSQFGQTFKPETGAQVEVGVKYQSEDYSKEANLSAFHIVKSDVVVTDPTSANYQDDIQVGEVRSQGIELEGKAMLTTAWDVSGSYTYTDMEITKDSNNGLQGTTPIYVPEHAAMLWTNYYLDSGVFAGTRVGGGVRYVGSMQMDATNTQGKVPAYAVADLSLGYDLSNVSEALAGAQASIVANNLFNEEYYTCYDQSNCWYGAERSFELNINYEF